MQLNDLIKEGMLQDILGEEQYTEYLEHYGTPRHSGRYPWGSGEDPYQHQDLVKQNLLVGDFRNNVKKLEAAGISKQDICKIAGVPNVASLNERYRIDNDDYKLWAYNYTLDAREAGVSWDQIAKELRDQGYPAKNESTPRQILKAGQKGKREAISNTVSFLKDQVDQYGFVEVGAGANQFVKAGNIDGQDIGVSVTKMNAALTQLEGEGYRVYERKVPSVTNAKHMNTMKILCPPGTHKEDIYPKKDEEGNIISDIVPHSLADTVSDNNGESFHPRWQRPSSLDSKRLQVVYAEDGGKDKDGLIELRRGCKDLSLGDANFAQVRIMVDGTHYLKGMAVYADDLPEGVDVRFNTNKHKGKPVLGPDDQNTVLKRIKSDPDNPFGANLRQTESQYTYIGDDGKEHLSPINKTRHEGDWEDWRDKVPSQFLAKQDISLIEKQLKTSIEKKQKTLEEINAITNPVLKKKMLLDFAEGCDRNAVDLSAAPLPGQKYHVILPMPKLKDGECYAPKYANGTKLALVRYPHAGTFEIPIVTVNNNYAEGKRMIGTDSNVDAIGIKPKDASRLSGADFDGDTVMAIPITSEIRIKSTDPFEGLVDFDPDVEFPPVYAEVKNKETGEMETKRISKSLTKKTVQKEMGVISNLITDMTILGATDEELERAVKHSMVVIDAVKHEYNYKLSEEKNGIDALKRIYQKKTDGSGGYGGAATLISRAKSDDRSIKIIGSPKINQEGKSWYDPSKPLGSLIYSTVADDDKRYKKFISKADRAALEAEGWSTKEIDAMVQQGHKPDGTPLDIKEKDQLQYKTISNSQRKKLEDMGFDNRQIFNIIENEEFPDGSTKFPDGKPLNVKINERMTVGTKMGNTDDAMTLLSADRKPKELLYANYANSLKDMANKARYQSVTTKDIPYSKTAKQAYIEEYKSLVAKVNKAKSNSPRERMANMLANNRLQAKRRENPDMSKGDLKKEANRLLNEARIIYKSSKDKVEVSDREWEAIQAGAIPPTVLKDVIENGKMETIVPRALPHETKAIPPAMQSKIRSYALRGYGPAEIAEYLGLSISTIAKYMDAQVAPSED